MALGFGTTEGGSLADRIETSLTDHSAQRSFSMLAYLSTGGAFSAPRLFEKRVSGSQVELLFLAGGAAEVSYVREFSGSRGRWDAPLFASNVWVQVGVSYDSSSVSNNARIYFNGVEQAAVRSDTPSGVVDTNTDPYVVGNRGDGLRCWPGRMAEFAIWDRLLTDEEWAGLGAGFSPSCFPRSLVSYVPLVREKIDLLRAAPTIIGTVVQNHPRTFYPSAPTVA